MKPQNGTQPQTDVDAALAANPMLTAIRGTPDHFNIGWSAAAGVGDDFTDVRHLIVCGMGGSAFPADLLALDLAPRGVRLTVSRDYRVELGGDPNAPIPADALVVASSFSGNTEETLAAYADAGRRGARRVVLTGGGRLAERAAADGVPVIRLRKPFADFQPRAASAMFVGALGRLAADLGLVEHDALAAAFDDVASHLRRRDVDADASALADALDGTIPLILVAAPHATTARAIRIKLNENAKMAAMTGALPEFNHNAMVGFTRPGPLAVVLLRDPHLTPRARHRAEVTAAVLAERKVPVHAIDLPDATPLTQAFDALYLFDLVTCRLALRAGFDPNPVELIEGFKARLGSTPTTTD